MRLAVARVKSVLRSCILLLLEFEVKAVPVVQV